MYKPSKKRKRAASNTQKSVQKPRKRKVMQQKEIEKEVEEVIASIVLMPSKTRSRRIPHKLFSSSIIYDAPIKKKKLSKMLIPAEVKGEEEEEEEEEEAEVSLIRSKNIVDDEAHKVTEGTTLRGAQLLDSAMLDQAEKQPITSDDLLEEVVVEEDILETIEIQVVEVITGLKFVERVLEVEAYVVQEEVLSDAATNFASKATGEENLSTPDAMKIDITGRNIKSSFDDCFDYSTLNHKLPTPSPNPSNKPSPKHTSSLAHQSEPMMESPNPTPIIQILEKAMNVYDSEHPTGESSVVHKQLTQFPSSGQPTLLNTIHEPHIDVSSGKDSSNSE